MLLEERQRKEIIKWLSPGLETGLHQRIGNRGIMQSTHLMCMGYSPDRAFALSPKARRARVLSMLSKEDRLRTL